MTIKREKSLNWFYEKEFVWYLTWYVNKTKAVTAFYEIQNSNRIKMRKTTKWSKENKNKYHLLFVKSSGNRMERVKLLVLHLLFNLLIGREHWRLISGRSVSKESTSLEALSLNRESHIQGDEDQSCKGNRGHSKEFEWAKKEYEGAVGEILTRKVTVHDSLEDESSLERKLGNNNTIKTKRGWNVAE